LARPKFKPTNDHRELVRKLSALGTPQEDICALVGIRSPKTLRKHFRRELDRGMTEATVKVGQTLFRMATSGQNLKATLFWMNTRAQKRSRVIKTKAVWQVETYQPPVTEEYRKQIEEMLASLNPAKSRQDSRGDSRRGRDDD
jgi:hypothetical protein